MIDIDEVLQEWEVDSKIDMGSLGDESSKNPLMHSKYLRYYSHFKHMHRKCEKNVRDMKAKLTKYYSGLMTSEELANEGWYQYQGRKPIKDAMNDMIIGHPDYYELNSKLKYYEDAKEDLYLIIKEIHARGFNIKSCIEWVKWENGE